MPVVTSLPERASAWVRSFQRGAALAAALLLVLAGALGCVSSGAAARRIVEAPNLHDSLGEKKEMARFWSLLQTNLDHGQLTASFRYLTVPVGPPAAEIKTMIIPPRDYQVKVSSRVQTNSQGRRSLTVWMTSETNQTAPFKPLPRPPTIFLLHGYMLPKETMAPWGLLLAQAGYRVVLVDLRGHGQSTGDTVSFGKYETADLEKVLDYLVARGDSDGNVGVLGYSFGATLALHWAAHDSRVRTVVAVAPYNHPDQAFERLARELRIPITRRAADQAVALAAAKLDLNWADWSGEAAIRQVQTPVLLVGGGRDKISRPDDIAALQRAGAGEVRTIMIPGADHVAVPLWFHELGDPVQSWFKTHLESVPETPGNN